MDELLNSRRFITFQGENRGQQKEPPAPRNGARPLILGPAMTPDYRRHARWTGRRRGDRPGELKIIFDNLRRRPSLISRRRDASRRASVNQGMRNFSTSTRGSPSSVASASSSCLGRSLFWRFSSRNLGHAELLFYCTCLRGPSDLAVLWRVSS